MQAEERLSHYLWKLSEAEKITTAMREEVPEEWHRIEHDFPVEEKRVKVTLLLDESLAKFYRGMGRGWHARVNHILGTWAQMKIAQALDEEEQMSEGFLRALVERNRLALERRDRDRAARDEPPLDRPEFDRD